MPTSGMPTIHTMRPHQVSSPNLHHGYGYPSPPNFGTPSQPKKKKKHAKAKAQRQSPPLQYYPAPQVPETYYSGRPVHGESYYAPLEHDRRRRSYQPAKKMPGDSATPIPVNDRKSKLNAFFAGLSVASYIAAIMLGIFIMVGCVAKSTALDNLYVTKLSTNETYDIQLRVGYFGGCVSVANMTGGASISSNNSSEYGQTHCVMNMRATDPDDLSEEFWEDLVLTDGTQTQLKETLNKMLPLARHLQADVFYWYPPVLHFVFFFISSLMLFVSLASSSYKRRYKSVLVLAALFGAFALALAFVTAIGSLQALNVLVNGGKSKNAERFDGDIFIHRADWLDHLQAAQVSVVAVFYVVMGIMFVKRKPEVGLSVFQVFPVSGVRKFLGGRR